MLKPSLQLRIGQQLTMTPQLQQAIRLLQLPVMELQSQIQEALESNVMLEAVEDDSTTPTPATEAEGTAEPSAATSDSVNGEAIAGDTQEAPRDERQEEQREDSYEENWDRGVTAAESRGASGEPRTTQEFADTSGQTLQDHLLWQLELENFTPREVVIGRTLIDSINDDGYLTESVETIHGILAAAGEVSVAEVEDVLFRIQTLDPIGSGARTIPECLTRQLQQLDPKEPARDLALCIVDEYLDLLAEHQYPALRRRLKVSEEELELAIVLVHSLHPRPGAGINSAPPEYVVPDVFVRKIDGRWLVELNSGLNTSLRVNQSYASQIARGSEHSTLRTQLQEARWLVRSLEIRNDTLYKVANCIVNRQHEFLDRGDEAMTPMVLRDVAEELEMHESTISRVTTNKYMHTPRGVIEFRYFFSSHIGTTDGNELSSVAIRAKIRKLINCENPAKPLSDNKIAQVMADEGINVARRTIAKYRESMSIPSSSERKKLARH